MQCTDARPLPLGHWNVRAEKALAGLTTSIDFFGHSCGSTADLVGDDVGGSRGDSDGVLAALAHRSVLVDNVRASGTLCWSIVAGHLFLFVCRSTRLCSRILIGGGW